MSGGRRCTRCTFSERGILQQLCAVGLARRRVAQAKLPGSFQAEYAWREYNRHVYGLHQ